MGGQACVFYGAAEFSRDIDFAILADALNLARLRKALARLRAENKKLKTASGISAITIAVCACVNGAAITSNAATNPCILLQ